MTLISEKIHPFACLVNTTTEKKSTQKKEIINTDKRILTPGRVMGPQSIQLGKEETEKMRGRKTLREIIEENQSLLKKCRHLQTPGAE